MEMSQYYCIIWERITIWSRTLSVLLRLSSLRFLSQYFRNIVSYHYRDILCVCGAILFVWHFRSVSTGALLFSSRVLRPSLVMLCSHKSGRCAVELYHAPHLWYPPFYTSPMASSALQQWLNRLPYKVRLPLTSWWRKSSNMTVGQSSLISLTHHCYDWHPGSCCGWTCNQLTSKVDGGITGSRLRWSILT